MEVCNLGRHRAVCFVPEVTMGSTAGPQETLKIQSVPQLHIQSAWMRLDETGRLGDQRGRDS